MIFFLKLLCEALTIAIFARAVLTWFSPRPGNTLVNVLYHVTEPVLAPLRCIIPTTGRVDFTPLVAIILLQLIARFLP
ncbi:MAG: YggT family protein [Dehalococcoidales bacterium]|nr:YggT family protein [Dehalococcoidales bacterium]